MISRVIEWCARNRFLVFTAVLLLNPGRHLVAAARAPGCSAGYFRCSSHHSHHWAASRPTSSKIRLLIRSSPALLAAPHVKAVRAQTMFGDSYVFVVFEDGTDLYWARSRVLEYLQQISASTGRTSIPSIGPDATGAGWVYEYALVDHTHKYSLADLRSLQDWHLRYQLETVPGVAEVASIGGFVRQYQVKLDPEQAARLRHSAFDRHRPGRNQHKRSRRPGAGTGRRANT